MNRINKTTVFFGILFFWAIIGFLEAERVNLCKSHIHGLPIDVIDKEKEQTFLHKILPNYLDGEMRRCAKLNSSSPTYTLSFLNDTDRPVSKVSKK